MQLVRQWEEFTQLEENMDEIMSSKTQELKQKQPHLEEGQKTMSSNDAPNLQGKMFYNKTAT